MANQNAKGWRRLVNAWHFSQAGFRAAYQHEEAFRQEVWVLIALLPLGLWLGEAPLERALLIGSLLLVPIVELLNSAIETVVDRIGLERHELSGRAKDIGSAAVFLVIVFATSVWALILIPRWL